MVYRFGEHELDRDRLELRRSGELLDVVWCGVAVSQASVRRVIVEVRRALGDETHCTIVTVRGRGFRFTGEVVEQANVPCSRSSGLPAAVGDPRLAALWAKLEEARQLYQQLLEAADACSSLDALTAAGHNGTSAHPR